MDWLAEIFLWSGSFQTLSANLLNEASHNTNK